MDTKNRDAQLCPQDRGLWFDYRTTAHDGRWVWRKSHPRKFFSAHGVVSTELSLLPVWQTGFITFHINFRHCLTSNPFFKVCVLEFSTIPAFGDVRPALDWDGIPGMTKSPRTESSFERRAKFFTRQENCTYCKPNSLRLLFTLTACIII